MYKLHQDPRQWLRTCGISGCCELHSTTNWCQHVYKDWRIFDTIVVYVDGRLFSDSNLSSILLIKVATFLEPFGRISWWAAVMLLSPLNPNRLRSNTTLLQNIYTESIPIQYRLEVPNFSSIFTSFPNLLLARMLPWLAIFMTNWQLVKMMPKLQTAFLHLNRRLVFLSTRPCSDIATASSI